MNDSIEKQNVSLDMINRWLGLASLAPSGANLQPWSCIAQQIENGFKITLGLSREYLKSPSSIDPFFFAALVSLGAFAKNLEVAAQLDGYHCTGTIHSGNTPSEWLWILDFHPSPKSAPNALDLKAALLKRVSNRNPFSRIPLATVDWDTTRKILKRYPAFTLVKSPKKDRNVWINILSLLEKVRCHDDRLRAELFQEIRSQQELLKDPIGLPIDTVTDSTSEKWLLLQLKKWPKLQLILKCGAEYFFIRSSVRKPLIHTGELLMLQSQSPDARFGFEMGMLLEELWLRWTEGGYSLQILALPLLIHGSQSDEFVARLSTQNQNRLKKANAIAKGKLAVNLNLPTLIIRIGKAKKSAPQSPRQDVSLESLK